MAGPLEGVRVVDVSQMISGPIAARILADQGADVIKVEPHAGDLVRAMGPTFATSNWNKRSLALDLKKDAGRDALYRLVRGADVFVQNFRPGRVDAMGIGEKRLREERADLVYVSISGFGETGPYAHKRVYDPVIQALSGLAGIQGDRVTGRPRMVRTIVPDKLTAMTAAQAIVAALFRRERTGRGEHVRLAMLDAMVSFLWPEGMARYTVVRDGEEPAEPGRAQVRDLVFQTKDGYMTAGTVSNEEWQSFARAVGRPEWIDDERFATPAARVVNWDLRLDLMQEELQKKTTAEWLKILDDADVPCAPVNGRRDLLTDPQIAANELIVEAEHPTLGRIRQTRPAARFEQAPAELRRPAPGLGEHSDEVLAEAGYGADEIAALREQGVVR